MATQHPATADHGRPVRWLRPPRDFAPRVSVMPWLEAQGWTRRWLFRREDDVVEWCYDAADGTSLYIYRTSAVSWGGVSWIAIVGEPPPALLMELERRAGCIPLDDLLTLLRSDRSYDRVWAVEGLRRVAEPMDRRVLVAIEAAAEQESEYVQQIAAAAIEEIAAGPRVFRRYAQGHTVVVADEAGTVYFDDDGRLMRWDERSPVVLADDLASPTALAIADADTLWVVQSDPPDAARLLRIGRDGGEPVPVGRPLCRPGPLRVFDGVAYVAEDGHVLRITAGGDLEAIAPVEQPCSLAVDASGVHWLDGDVLWTVRPGEDPRRLAPLGSQTQLAAGPRGLFACDDRRVLRIDVETGAVTTVVDEPYSDWRTGFMALERWLLWENVYEMSYAEHHALQFVDLGEPELGHDMFEDARRYSRVGTPLTVPFALTSHGLDWAIGGDVVRLDRDWVLGE